MKVVIFTGIGGFEVPDVIVWHLVIHNGWKIADNFDEYDYKSSDKTFIKKEYKFSGDISSYHLPLQYDMRDDPELTAAYEYWKPEEYKVIDIPDHIKWYIDESDCGSESIHEEHRIWS